jgi:hypothetical protein
MRRQPCVARTCMPSVPRLASRTAMWPSAAAPLPRPATPLPATLTHTLGEAHEVCAALVALCAALEQGAQGKGKEEQLEEAAEGVVLVRAAHVAQQDRRAGQRVQRRGEGAQRVHGVRVWWW